MKRKIFIGLLVIIALFVSLRVVYAFLTEDDTGGSGGNSSANTTSGTSESSSSSSGIFGGKITETKASKIQSLEDEGYTCDVSGSSIEINPIKGPSSYIIPSGTISKTGYAIRSGQWILGKYSGKTTVTCTKQCGETECTSTAILDTITLFGTSR